MRAWEMRTLEVIMTSIPESYFGVGCFWFLRNCMAGLRRAETSESTTGSKIKLSTSSKHASVPELTAGSLAECEPELLGSFSLHCSGSSAS